MAHSFQMELAENGKQNNNNNNNNFDLYSSLKNYQIIL